ncbi:MAG: AarF/ABC1/UbiB kinase family protein [Candidatus Sericytochromatia bacterium]|nr:AarF/ABC1/UbiB kinase family protein [Candidatus Sericytochromatia bacterium]
MLRAAPDATRWRRILRRTLQVVWVAVRFAWARRQARQLAEDPAASQNAERRLAAWLREQCVALGPTFIKVGQALSTRVDLLPLSFIEELAHLQDRVPPFSTPLARRFIEEELGQPVGQLFVDFPSEPIAAASLGQVYQTRLRTGEEVAVKVQRPDLLERFAVDLAALRLLAGWVARYTDALGSLPLVEILDEFDRNLHAEIDYRREADNADRFRANFARFPGVAVPKMYRAYSSRRVLTMEFMHGVRVTDLPALHRLAIDPPRLVKHAVHVNLKQLLEDGFYHADLHPGNIMVDQAGSLIFIDFGLVGELPRPMQLRLVDTFLHLVDQDVDALVGDMAALGFIEPGKDPAPLKPTIRWILDATYQPLGHRPTFREMTEPLADIFYRYRLRVPVSFSMIIRTLISLEGIGLQLDPHFHALDVSIPFAAKLLLTEGGKALRDRFLRELVRDGRLDWDRLEELLRLARRDPDFRIGEVLQVGVDWFLSPDGAGLRETLFEAVVGDPDIDWERIAALGENLLADPSIDREWLVRRLTCWLLSPDSQPMRQRLTAALASDLLAGRWARWHGATRCLRWMRSVVP